MNSRKVILILFGLLALTAMLFAAGCGEEQTATQSQCDPDAPSVIPVTQGRPQLVEFFRDT